MITFYVLMSLLFHTQVKVKKPFNLRTTGTPQPQKLSHKNNSSL